MEAERWASSGDLAVPTAPAAPPARLRQRADQAGLLSRADVDRPGTSGWSQVRDIKLVDGRPGRALLLPAYTYRSIWRSRHRVQTYLRPGSNNRISILASLLSLATVTMAAVVRIAASLSPCGEASSSGRRSSEGPYSGGASSSSLFSPRPLSSRPSPRARSGPVGVSALLGGESVAPPARSKIPAHLAAVNSRLAGGDYVRVRQHADFIAVHPDNWCVAVAVVAANGIGMGLGAAGGWGGRGGG